MRFRCYPRPEVFVARKLSQNVSEIDPNWAKKIEKSSLKLRRSIFTIKDIKKGEKFSRLNIGNLRPKIGIGSENFSKLIGKKSLKFYKKDSAIF